MSNCGAYFRLYTHYGRLDDLAKKPESGVRQVRIYNSQAECDAGFLKIYRQKTSASKGYKPVNLASSKIGSEKAKGMNAGAVGQRTKKQSEKNEKRRQKRQRKKERNKNRNKDDSSSSESESDSSEESDSDVDDEKNEKKDYKLHKEVIDLVQFLYQEAKDRIQTKVDVTITYVLLFIVVFLLCLSHTFKATLFSHTFWCIQVWDTFTCCVGKL